MKNRARLADVARAARVSLMTVSRAINNKPGVSEELREKILNIAAEMDYHPSQTARSLATSQTATLGLVVPTISNPFYAAIAQGVEDVAAVNGYSVFLMITDAHLGREVAALSSLRSHDIDGAILCSYRLPDEELEYKIHHFPAVVLFNREVVNSSSNVVSIGVNDQRAAYESIQYFLARGRRHIAFIGGPADSFSSQCRLEGYRTALKEGSIPIDPSLVMHILPSTESGKEAADQLLESDPGIDAILAFNDLVAVGVLQACQSAGRAVPEDVAVIGSDDIPLASLVRPKLSTTRVDLEHVGRLSTRTLIKRLAGGITPSSYTIEPQLVLRESA